VASAEETPDIADVVVPADTPAAAPKAKRPVGRPKKSSGSSVASAEETQELADVVIDLTASFEEAAPKAKRPVGRPKKSADANETPRQLMLPSHLLALEKIKKMEAVILAMSERLMALESASQATAV
jgi:hypothetical protein